MSRLKIVIPEGQSLICAMCKTHVAGEAEFHPDPAKAATYPPSVVHPSGCYAAAKLEIDKKQAERTKRRLAIAARMEKFVRSLDLDRDRDAGFAEWREILAELNSEIV